MRAPDPKTPASSGLREDDIPYSAEVARKALHLLALVVPLFIALTGKETALGVLVPLSLLALAADILRTYSEGFARFIYRAFGFMMRGSERPPAGGPVTFNGATWVLVTATLLTVIFPVRIAVAAFVVFMISDAAAALVGRRYGRHYWGRGPRTVEGSAAFLVTGMIIVALMPGIRFWVGAVSVVAACGAEALPRPFNDNIRVPFVAAIMIALLEWLVLGASVRLFLATVPHLP